MADESRTQRATPRRRLKAREKGQVAVSRELPGALAFLSVVLLLHGRGAAWISRWRDMMARFLKIAAHGELSSHAPVFAWSGYETIRWVAPAVLLGWGVAVASLAAQTGFLFAPEAFKPNWGRLNPVQNIGRLFSAAGLSRLLKSLLPFGAILALAGGVIAREWNNILHASQIGLRPALDWLGEMFFEISWKSGFVLLAWAGVDYGLQRFGYERSIRMSRQELREEVRDTEGSPAIKTRLRKRRRELWRKWRMKDLARATVVVTNPDEFAVALEYNPKIMPAPVVIAKGRDLLAQKIKKEARWLEVPIVENPPLARALYAAANVGEMIPAKLYTAVAELLAFIYRARTRVRPASSAAASAAAPGGM